MPIIYFIENRVRQKQNRRIIGGFGVLEERMGFEPTVRY